MASGAVRTAVAGGDEGTPLLRFPPVVGAPYRRIVFWGIVCVLGDPILESFFDIHGTALQRRHDVIAFVVGWLVTFAGLALLVHLTLPRAPAGRRPPQRRRWTRGAAVTLGVTLSFLLRALPPTGVALLFGAFDGFFVIFLGMLILDHHRWRRFGSFR